MLRDGDLQGLHTADNDAVNWLEDAAMKNTREMKWMTVCDERKLGSSRLVYPCVTICLLASSMDSYII